MLKDYNEIQDNTILDIYLDKVKTPDINIINLLKKTDLSYILHKYVKKEDVKINIINILCNSNELSYQDKTNNNYIPLHTYINTHNTQTLNNTIINKLTEEKIKNIVDTSDNTPLHLYIVKQNNLSVEIIKNLISNDKMTLNIRNNKNMTVLDEFIKKQEEKEAKEKDIMLTLFTDKNIIPYNKSCPLYNYIKFKKTNTDFDIEIIQILGNDILSINYVDENTKNTSLMCYIIKCQELNKDINKDIIDYLANDYTKDYQNNYGFTPLHQYLTTKINKDIIKSLLKDSNHKLILNNLNYTPLHIYVKQANNNINEDIFNLLLDNDKKKHLSIKCFDTTNNKKELTIKDLTNTKNKNIIKLLQIGGSDYYNKYLKYKNKYILLKSKM
jgi:hypothetical protein